MNYMLTMLLSSNNDDETELALQDVDIQIAPRKNYAITGRTGRYVNLFIT